VVWGDARSYEEPVLRARCVHVDEFCRYKQGTHGDAGFRICKVCDCGRANEGVKVGVQSNFSRQSWREGAGLKICDYGSLLWWCEAEVGLWCEGKKAKEEQNKRASM
jgi:hypothetical protein